MTADTAPADDCVTISLLNMKGGVGKTTLAVNLAWYLCRFAARRVLLVDLDPQFNASQYIMAPEVWNKHRQKPGTVADLLLEPHKPEMRLKKKRTARQARLTQYLHVVEERQNGGLLRLLPSELVLAKAIKSPEGIPYKLEKELLLVRSSYNYVIIDCAPTDSVLTDTALMASDFILIPMKPDRFSVLGYALMQETLDSFRNTYPDPHGTTDLGVIFTQVAGASSIEAECMDEIVAQAGYVFSAQIPHSASYARSARDRRPIFATSYAREPTKRALTAVAKELMERLDEVG